MKQAVGASFFILFINLIIGFNIDSITGVRLNITFLLTITGMLGLIVRTKLSKMIDEAKLKPTFGRFVLIIGIYIITK